MLYDVRRMVAHNIVIACSSRKLSEPAPAGEIYTGPVWLTWRAHRPERLPAGWRLWALSALHGLIPSDRVIEPYDHRLEPSQVDQLAALVASQWHGNVAATVVMVGGSLYQEAAKRARLPIVQTIDGAGSAGERGGIGRMRERLASWAREIHEQAA